MTSTSAMQYKNRVSSTPVAQGFHMPAEWEPHEATWLAWPHNEETWFAKTPQIPRIYAEITKALSPGEKVRILVPDAETEGAARESFEYLGAWNENVELIVAPTNDAWARDFAPTFITRDKPGSEREVAMVNWNFNSWGDKYPWHLDNAIPDLISNQIDMKAFVPDIVMEGGSLDVNGKGTLITTESCLLNPNRNPNLSPSEIEEALKNYLGVRHILWLGDGIVGDDTDGHVDDFVRFVGPRTVVAAVEENPADENYNILQYNLGRLKRMRDQDGLPLDVVQIPMPSPVEYEGQRLPASYANFYIGNEVVLVPIYECGTDQTALNIIKGLFPHRKVIGINCIDLVLGLGAIHCITQQQPAGRIIPRSDNK